MPPNFEKIPAPDTILKKNENEKDKIKKILKAPKSENLPKNKSSSTEQEILNKIRK